MKRLIPFALILALPTACLFKDETPDPPRPHLLLVNPCADGMDLAPVRIGFDSAAFSWRPCAAAGLVSYSLEAAADSAYLGSGPTWRMDPDAGDSIAFLADILPGAKLYARLTARFRDSSLFHGPVLAFRTLDSLGDFSPISVGNVWEYRYLKTQYPAYNLPPDSGNMRFTLESRRDSGGIVYAGVRFHSLVVYQAEAGQGRDSLDTLIRDGLFTFKDSSGILECMDCGDLEFHPFAARHVFEKQKLLKWGNGFQPRYYRQEPPDAPTSFRKAVYIPGVGGVRMSHVLGAGPSFYPVLEVSIAAFNGSAFPPVPR